MFSPMMTDFFASAVAMLFELANEVSYRRGEEISHAATRCRQKEIGNFVQLSGLLSVSF
jgi:hypothetical protein